VNSTLIQLLAFLSVVSVASAQDTIEGAFGIRLGQEFKGDLKMEDAATTRHPLTPEKPFQGLTEYSVDISLKSHRVCSINAVGPASDGDEAWRLMTLLAIILKEKYPSDPIQEEANRSQSGAQRVRKIYPLQSSSLEQETRITQGQRTIHIYSNNRPATGTPRFYVGVRYTDNALLAEAAKEAEMMRAEAKAKEDAEEEAKEKAAREAFELKRRETEARRSELRKQLEVEAKKVDSSGL
jgi:hypothetical protein